jgi:hypothetical protein
MHNFTVRKFYVNFEFVFMFVYFSTGLLNLMG